MNNRAENHFIRNIFAKHFSFKDEHGIRHYNDLRTHGRRRIFKSHLSTSSQAAHRAFKKVLNELQDTIYKNRWELWVGPNGQLGIVCFQER